MLNLIIKFDNIIKIKIYCQIIEKYIINMFIDSQLISNCEKIFLLIEKGF